MCLFLGGLNMFAVVYQNYPWNFCLMHNNCFVMMNVPQALTWYHTHTSWQTHYTAVTRQLYKHTVPGKSAVSWLQQPCRSISVTQWGDTEPLTQLHWNQHRKSYRKYRKRKYFEKCPTLVSLFQFYCTDFLFHFGERKCSTFQPWSKYRAWKTANSPSRWCTVKLFFQSVHRCHILIVLF